MGIVLSVRELFCATLALTPGRGRIVSASGSFVSTTFASSASRHGALSPMGEAVTMLPPIVARLRIWREPNTRSMAPNAENSSASLSSISVSVTVAPMCHSVAVDLISFNSATASVEISVGNFL